jgi:antitoxin CptB
MPDRSHPEQYAHPEQDSQQSENNRVYWASRRGMLELDLVLMPYAKEVYPQLAAADRHAYQTLLEQEDTDLFAWFLQKSTPEDAVLAQVVAKVLEFARTRPL